MGFFADDIKYARWVTNNRKRYFKRLTNTSEKLLFHHAYKSEYYYIEYVIDDKALDIADGVIAANGGNAIKTAATTGDKFCTDCGTKNPESAKFCCGCGKK